jgi:hypothetical protein
MPRGSTHAGWWESILRVRHRSLLPDTPDIIFYERGSSSTKGRGTMPWRTDITLGQRFRDAGLTAFGTPSRTVWVVAGIWDESDGLVYVRLVNEGSPNRTKTLSRAALLDRRLYVRAEEKPGEPGIGESPAIGTGLEPYSAT